MREQVGWSVESDHAEVLDVLLAEEGVETAGAEPARLTRAAAEAPVLSFAQRQIWFFEQWHPSSAAYNVGNAFWVSGPLDPAVLERAAGEVCRRHEVLRGGYEVQGGEAVPRSPSEVRVPVPVVDLTDVAEDDRAAAALDIAEQEVRRPFALTSDPLLRLRLVRLAENRHLLVLTVHHLAFDGASLDIVLAELDRLYQDFAAGRESRLPEPALRYQDYAVWERARWSRGELAGDLEYWRGQLSSAPDVLALPADRPRPAVQTFAGRTLTAVVPRHTVDAIRQVAAAHGTTPFGAFLAAFDVLAARLSGQEDLVVGVPVTMRTRSELEHMVGMLVNTVPVRTDISGDPTFAEVLGRVHSAAGDAFSHSAVPFDRLVTELRPERILSHSPIVQVVFGLEDEPGGPRRLGPAELADVYVERGTAKFDMTWSVRLGAETTIQVEYNVDLFDEATVERMTGHYLRVLAAVAEDPARRIGQIDLLTEADKLAIGTPRQGADFSSEDRIHRADERIARRVPDAPAVTFDDEHLTYRELDSRANRLAHHLRAHGVTTESVVGVCAEPGLDLVVSLLAVLKAGAVYLPVPPAYPAERLRFMLADSHAEVVIAHAGAHVPEGTWRILDPEAESAVIGEQPDDAPPESSVSPDNLAYIIYTSGSTGTPKGVGIPHRNVIRLLSATDDWFGFDDEDVWTLFHSYAFDFSVWEIWGALCTGGRLVVVPREVTRSPADFLALLAREKATILNQTPSAFVRLEEADREGRETLALRLVMFGGEPVDLGSVGRWLARHGEQSPRLVNMYGITETTVHVTARQLTATDAAGQVSPIGVPIPDLTIRVLDRWGSPVPVGVPGELHIGGPGVARGYLGRPGLTAERFVPDALATTPGARLYRSGDLARYTVDGQLEYLGRHDDQVKIRGFRIELGEVEAALARYPGVRAAAVLAGRKSSGPATLVAYLAADPAPATDEVREFLGRVLPDYMVPAVVVVLDELPMTPNGKIDRKALPEPDTARPRLAGQYTAPSGVVPELLADVWARVLDVDKVGVHDSFFDLGGDSIRALQVLSLVKESGYEFTLQELFGNPTVADLAPSVQAASGGERDREPFSLLDPEDRAALPDGLVDAYPLSALQAGMVYHMQLDPENLPYHNVNSFHLRAPYDPELFDRAVQDVVARHPILRTSFDLLNFSEPLQLVHPSATLPVEVADISALPARDQEDELLRVLHEERHRPFDLAEPPFLRYLLHRRGENEFQWTVTEHHAIFDGWSLFSTQAEVLRRYLLLLDDPAAVADPPPASAFRDFIALERESVASERDREYWKDKLADHVPTNLPAWPARNAELVSAEDYDSPLRGETGEEALQWQFTSTHNASHRSLEALIPIEVCDALLGVAAKAGTPFKSVLLAAHLKVIGLVTGQRDVVTGLTAHGRPEDVDSTEVRGLFLNVPPLRVDLTGGTWADLARRAFEAEQELMPHRRYPLARMQWDLGGVELFDNTFLYNHFHVMQDVIGDGVEFVDYRIESTTEYRAEPTNYSLSTGFLRNPRSSQLLLRLDYYTGKVSDAQAEAMRAYYLAVLTAMTQADDPHDAFSPLRADERHKMLVEWNGPARDYPVDQCVHELIEGQATRTPHAVAVVDEDTELTYAQLDARANQLAQRLRAAGAGAESVVGVCVRRDSELVVTLLGVMKSGAAYLPLDPSYPPDRLRFMLDDSGARLVVTRDELAGRIPDGDWQVIRTDAEAAEIAALPSVSPGRRSAPDQLVYVMYTSGSTGTPKGVQVQHSGVVNYLGWCVEAYACRGTGGAPVFSSFAFDMIVPNLFTPLIMGQRVCVLPDSLDPTRLAAQLNRLAPFSFIKMTPGHLDLLSQSLGPESARNLAGTLAVGADAFPSRNLANWRRVDPQTVVLNEYGPTEASVGNCVFHTDGPVDSDLLPIGRPIPNTTMYVLDDAMNPVPVGTTGEMYIGGDCVVRGYASRPALTAERFVPDPFAATPGARMYRTGDLGRWLPDGQLDFLGRVDEQVKLNGYRIELGEVESVLAEHPSVARSVAAVVGANRENRRLVAYYVPAAEVAPERLMAHLAERLPAHAMPAMVVAIDAVPLNPNGKVDRKALPDPVTARGPAGVEHVEPRLPIEELVASIWVELLGVERAGVLDNFFALGGNSLSATQFAFRARRALGVDVPLTLVVGTRTLGELALAVGEKVREQHGDEVARMLLEPAAG